MEKGLLFCEHILAGCYAINNFDALKQHENYFKKESAKDAEIREYYSNMGTKKNETRRRGNPDSRQHRQHATEYISRKRCYSEFDESPNIPAKRTQNESDDGHLSDTDDDVLVLKTSVPVAPPSRSLRTVRVREGDFSTFTPSHRPVTPYASNTVPVIPEEAPHR